MAKSTRIPSFKALRALDAVVRHQSISKAADELNVSPAAISQQLKTLEKDFDRKLVERKDGRFVVSKFVEAGLPDIREGFERVILGVKKMRDHHASRPLTITVEPSFAATWLLKRLPGFSVAYPDINIRLDPSMEVADLHHNDIDMGIRYGNGEYPEHRVDKIIEEVVSPVCSPDLLTGDHPLESPDDLRWHTLLHDDFCSEDKSIPSWEMWLESAGCDFEPLAHQHLPLSSMTAEAAALGQGIALMSNVITSEYLSNGRLVKPFDESLSTLADFSYYLVCLEEIADRPDVTAFRDWLLDEAGRA